MIGNKIKVSIIIPTYGRSNLLERAILSAINQSYKDVEVIVVDDNNKNSLEQIKTKELIKRLQIKHKIKYIEMGTNVGGPIARNKGVENSNGEYICFLDDDDEFYDHKISSQIKIVKNSKERLAVIGCFANILDGNGYLKRVEKNEMRGNVFLEQLKSNVCTTSIAMINKEVFIEVGGFDNVPSSQEHRLFTKIFKVNPYYNYVPEVLLNIHHHEGTRISNGKKKATGAISLHDYIKSLEEYKGLNKDQKNIIDIAHYKNIIRAFMVGKNQRIKAFKIYAKIMKTSKKIEFDNFKYLIIILFGLNNIEKIKIKIKNWR